MEQVVLNSIYDTLSRNLMVEELLLIDIVNEVTNQPKGKILEIIEKEKQYGRVYMPRVGMLSKVR